MKIITLMLLLSSLTTQLSAVEEGLALDFVVESIADHNKECPAVIKGDSSFLWQTKKFKSRHQGPEGKAYHVRYTRFGCSKGKMGSAVVAPGRTESSLKYLETAYDLVQRGYSPVFVIDHRGQGFSPRFLANTHKGHVENFKYYVDDFEDFMNQIVLSPKSGADRERLYLLSNSMGGAISTLYLQRMRQFSPIKAAVFFGPMIKILLDDTNAGSTRSESAVRLQASLLCLTGLTIGGQNCESYANPNWTDYDPTARSLDPQNPKPTNLTHSLNRFMARNYLWDDKWSDRESANYASYEVWNGLALGGPSVRWIWQAIKYNQRMRTVSALRDLKTPVMIVTGDQDIRADLSSHREFCQRLNRQGGSCKISFIKDAFHELMVESDEYRNQALRLMFSHFAQYAR